MSSHEVVDRMLQNNGELYKVSDKFVIVPTTFPRYRSRCMKKVEQLEKQDDTDLCAPDFIHDFYPRRPADMPDISLHDFGEKYEKCYNKSIPKRLRIEIKDQAGIHIVGRLEERPINKRLILQHHYFDVNKFPEALY